MATVPVPNKPVAAPSETLDERVRRLLDLWREETLVLSSTTAIESHPAYRELSALGPAALPYLFRDMEKTFDGHLSGVLSRITGAQPVPVEEGGKIRAVAQRWLSWGEGARLPMSVLESLFPGLRTTNYRVTSPHTGDYNCIAWAAGDTSNWWWPTSSMTSVPRFWPDGVPREVGTAAFVSVFATLGFAGCDSETPERGYEKIAFFADSNAQPSHAARQLPNGRWTSKLGNAEDIEHDLHALEGDIYGTVVLVMKRPLPA